MVSERFLAAFAISDGPVISVSSPMRTVGEWLDTVGGRTFEGGLYRVHTRDSARLANVMELVDFGEEALARRFFAQWRKSGGKPPALSECVAYRRPLFLGGQDVVQAMGIPEGTPISGYPKIRTPDNKVLQRPGRLLVSLRPASPGRPGPPAGILDQRGRSRQLTGGSRTRCSAPRWTSCPRRPAVCWTPCTAS
jgi:hypothetical protein